MDFFINEVLLDSIGLVLYKCEGLRTIYVLFMGLALFLPFETM